MMGLGIGSGSVDIGNSLQVSTSGLGAYLPMKTNVIRIGNSRGIRIPKALLEQCHLQDEVELEVSGDHLLVRPTTRPRSGWAEAFRRMHEQGDDAVLDKELLPSTRWERAEWKW